MQGHQRLIREPSRCDIAIEKRSRRGVPLRDRAVAIDHRIVGPAHPAKRSVLPRADRRGWARQVALVHRSPVDAPSRVGSRATDRRVARRSFRPRPKATTARLRTSLDASADRTLVRPAARGTPGPETDASLGPGGRGTPRPARSRRHRCTATRCAATGRRGRRTRSACRVPGFEQWAERSGGERRSVSEFSRKPPVEVGEK